MRQRFPVATLATAIVLVAASSTMRQGYTVSGVDTFRLGSGIAPSRISYVGTERLTSDGATPRQFVADISYARTDDSGTSKLHARFVQQIDRDGSFEDVTDEDPDFLAILNQPFAVLLDPSTMNDLRHLHGRVPFSAMSPLGKSQLRGTLRSAPGGSIESTPVVGVAFDATGPMTGSLPDHSDARLTGTISMNGTAYYATPSALLMGLDATLTIEGSLAGASASVPVRIVYRRSIRAAPIDT